VEVSEWRALIQSLREDWKELWRTKFNDEYRAEGVATKHFSRLFVERGEVIIATRDYRPPNFHEILKAYMPQYFADTLDPTPAQGGWGKFIREYIAKQKTKGGSSRKADKEERRPKPSQPSGFRRSRYRRLKKSGKRWKPAPRLTV